MIRLSHTVTYQAIKAYGNGKVSIDKGGASRDIATSPLPEAERRGMTAHFRRKEMARQIVPLRAVPLTGLAWIME